MARLSGEAEEKAKKSRPPCWTGRCSPSFPACPLYEPDDSEGRCRRNNAGLFFYSPAREKHLKEIEGGKGARRLPLAFQWEVIVEKVHFESTRKGKLYHLGENDRQWKSGGVGSESYQSLPLTVTTTLLLNDIGIDLFDAK